MTEEAGAATRLAVAVGAATTAEKVALSGAALTGAAATGIVMTALCSTCESKRAELAEWLRSAHCCQTESRKDLEGSQ